MKRKLTVLLSQTALDELKKMAREDGKTLGSEIEKCIFSGASEGQDRPFFDLDELKKTIVEAISDTEKSDHPGCGQTEKMVRIALEKILFIAEWAVEFGAKSRSDTVGPDAVRTAKTRAEIQLKQLFGG